MLAVSIVVELGPVPGQTLATPLDIVTGATVRSPTVRVTGVLSQPAALIATTLIAPTPTVTLGLVEPFDQRKFVALPSTEPALSVVVVAPAGHTCRSPEIVASGGAFITKSTATRALAQPLTVLKDSA